MSTNDEDFPTRTSSTPGKGDLPTQLPRGGAPKGLLTGSRPGFGRRSSLLRPHQERSSGRPTNLAGPPGGPGTRLGGNARPGLGPDGAGEGRDVKTPTGKVGTFDGFSHRNFVSFPILPPSVFAGDPTPSPSFLKVRTKYPQSRGPDDPRESSRSHGPPPVHDDGRRTAAQDTSHSGPGTRLSSLAVGNKCREQSWNRVFPFSVRDGRRGRPTLWSINRS